MSTTPPNPSPPSASSASSSAPSAFSSSRDRPQARRREGWSAPQRVLVLRACAAAGWNDQQRYVAMRASGCPSDPQSGRPSVKHRGNTQAHLEALMALAEAAAVDRGERVPRSREGRTWREVSISQGARLANLARTICAEARERLPEKFDAGLLAAAVRHVCGPDHPSLSPPPTPLSTVHPPLSTVHCPLSALDAGELIRVVECLRAWVGREFAQRGMRPTRRWSLPPSVSSGGIGVPPVPAPPSAGGIGVPPVPPPRSPRAARTAAPQAPGPKPQASGLSPHGRDSLPTGPRPAA